MNGADILLLADAAIEALESGDVLRARWLLWVLRVELGTAVTGHSYAALTFTHDPND